MKIIEHIHQDGPFGEYRVELTEEELSNKVDANTFRALSLVDKIYTRRGLVAALFAVVPLAIWSDFSKASRAKRQREECNYLFGNVFFLSVEKN